jgi:hypothetical protein
MKVLVCFTGLTRTISETAENLKQNLFSDNLSVTVVFITWKDENVDDFMKCFPEATVYRIPTVSIDDEHFLEWKKNTNMHHSWINTYGNNHNALFQYYRQIFLWKQSSIILENHTEFDIFVRARTDVKLSGHLLHTYYSKINSSNIFFPNQPRHPFIGNIGCPDYFFIAKRQVFHHCLSILDFINYVYVKYKYPIQPETVMHFHILDKNFHLEYMNNEVTIVRSVGFSKI